MTLDPGVFGTIAAIDLNRRTLIELTDFPVHVSRVRAVLGRAADFEDERIVSWGRLTIDEMLNLFACEQGEYTDVLEEQLLEFDQLLSHPERYAITLYYKYDGQ